MKHIGRLISVVLLRPHFQFEPSGPSCLLGDSISTIFQFSLFFPLPLYLDCLVSRLSKVPFGFYFCQMHTCTWLKVSKLCQVCYEELLTPFPFPSLPPTLGSSIYLWDRRLYLHVYHNTNTVCGMSVAGSRGWDSVHFSSCASHMHNPPNWLVSGFLLFIFSVLSSWYLSYEDGRTKQILSLSCCFIFLLSFIITIFFPSFLEIFSNFYFVGWHGWA